MFVYNADSGVFNTMADIGHKIFSPETYECALCSLTHGYFKERAQWREFVEKLDIECLFLHRDEFVKRYPGHPAKLPAIFVLRDDRPACCADADAIAGCTDLAALQTLIQQRCGG
jgi:hypothetical protein